MNDQLHAPAFLRPVSIEKEGKWGQWRREHSLLIPGQGVKLTTHPNLVLSLRLHVAIPPLTHTSL
jgi:hypothetical protein